MDSTLMRPKVLLVVALATSLWAFAGCSACSSGSGSASGIDGGFVDQAAIEHQAETSRDVSADDTALELDAIISNDVATDQLVGDGDGSVGPWDPVWHKTTPTQWPEVPRGQRPECGAHCRVIASSWADGTPDRAPKANDRWVVVQGFPNGSYYSTPPRAVAVDLLVSGEPKEYLIDDASWVPGGIGVGGVFVDADLLLSITVGTDIHLATLTSLVTGERKVIANVLGGTVGTALALPYAYWMTADHDEFVRFDTRDGTFKSSLQTGACEIVTGTSTGLGACASAGSGLTVIDFDKGTASHIADTGYQQTNGMLSQDGNDAIWIDFRDPGSNGEHGTYDQPWGGEVYHKTIGASGDERLTFDTPSSPAMKTSPWAQNGNLAWVTKAGTAMPNPTGSSVYWYGAGKIVVKPNGGPITVLPYDNMGEPRPISLGIVAGWYDSVTKRGWMVLLDWP